MMTKERAKEVLEAVWMRDWSGDDAWNEFENVFDDADRLQKENEQLKSRVIDLEAAVEYLNRPMRFDNQTSPGTT